MVSQVSWQEMTSQHTEDKKLEQICSELGITDAEEAFISEANPMHYKKRLIDLGINENDATELVHFYTEYIFIPIAEIYAHIKEQKDKEKK